MPEIQQSEITSAASGARQLGARAHQLASQGRLTEALESARKSVEQWRILAKQDSSNFLPELARSLDRLAIFLARAEIAGEAFEAAKESVRHWRQLAAANLERFGLELAGALRRLAADALGLYPRDFLSMREEATNVLLRLAAAAVNRYQLTRGDRGRTLRNRLFRGPLVLPGPGPRRERKAHRGSIGRLNHESRGGVRDHHPDQLGQVEQRAVGAPGRSWRGCRGRG